MPTKDLPNLARLRIPSDASTLTTSRPLNNKRWWIVAAALFVGVGLWFLFSSRTAPLESKPMTPAMNAPSAGNVANSPQAASPAGEGVLHATGYVVAQRKAAVSSKATGKLKALYVVEGDVVKEGDVMAVLEDDDLRALVREQEAQLISANARVASANAELTDAKLQFERTKSLAAGRVVAAAELDTAEARYRKSIAAFDLARADIAVAEARVEKVKVDLEFTQIRAPFDGTVLTKNADVGEIVAPFGSSTNARAAVVTIADMNSLQVETDISEANLDKVYVGQPCSIVLDSYPSHPYDGVVEKIVPTVDRAKATVLAKIRFQNKDKRVIPEMSAKVTFRLQETKDAPMAIQ